MDSKNSTASTIALIYPPMTKPAARIPLKNLRTSDILGVAKLAVQATVGVTRIVEGVHQSVWDTLGVSGGKRPGQTGGITGRVYNSIRAIAQLLGQGVDSVLVRLPTLLDSAAEAEPGTAQREAVLAALNGVMGDRLLASNNPFAIPMTLRYQGQALNWRA